MTKEIDGALEALSMLRTFTNIDDADCVGPLVSTIRAALTAQSVNGQLLKALKAKVNDALSMAETLGFYGELEKKALVAEYLITAIAAAEKAQGENNGN